MEAGLKAPVLHFAPEVCISKRLTRIIDSYRTADLIEPADLRIDIEKINLDSESQASVVCNHVLEHVNDRSALRELHRILVQGGVLVVSVPLIEGWSETYVNAHADTERLRDLHFGQNDHLRYFGSDFRGRLHDAGFRITLEYVASGACAAKYGLIRGEKLFICTKPLAQQSL